MVTGFEQGMYRDIGVIAQTLRSLDERLREAVDGQTEQEASIQDAHIDVVQRLDLVAEKVDGVGVTLARLNELIEGALTIYALGWIKDETGMNETAMAVIEKLGL